MHRSFSGEQRRRFMLSVSGKGTSLRVAQFLNVSTGWSSEAEQPIAAMVRPGSIPP
jgi:hypothetical protein